MIDFDFESIKKYYSYMHKEYKNKKNKFKFWLFDSSSYFFSKNNKTHDDDEYLMIIFI
jgi:hypothetical protein